ncbi:hypothetical protein TWF281_002949 [Arthrobotrys megalospora]
MASSSSSSSSEGSSHNANDNITLDEPTVLQKIASETNRTGCTHTPEEPEAIPTGTMAEEPSEPGSPAEESSESGSPAEESSEPGSPAEEAEPVITTTAMLKNLADNLAPSKLPPMTGFHDLPKSAFFYCIPGPEVHQVTCSVRYIQLPPRYVRLFEAFPDGDETLAPLPAISTHYATQYVDHKNRWFKILGIVNDSQGTMLAYFAELYMFEAAFERIYERFKNETAKVSDEETSEDETNKAETGKKNPINEKSTDKQPLKEKANTEKNSSKKRSSNQHPDEETSGKEKTVEEKRNKKKNPSVAAGWVFGPISIVRDCEGWLRECRLDIRNWAVMYNARYGDDPYGYHIYN